MVAKKVTAEKTTTRQRKVQEDDAPKTATRQRKVQDDAPTTTRRRRKRNVDPNRPKQPLNTYMMFIAEWKEKNPKEWQKLKKESSNVQDYAAHFKKLYNARSEKDRARLQKQYDAKRAVYVKEMEEYRARQ